MSAFLNGKLQEEIYMEQPPCFFHHILLNHVFKLDKNLYGLKQTPRAWYDTLSQFLLDYNFVTCSVVMTLFTFVKNYHTFIFQIYVDDMVQLTQNSTRSLPN